MNILEIIKAKKLNQALTREQINFLIDEYVSKKNITDYQVAALLMAVYFNGLNDDELFYLTEAMLHSGNTIKINKNNEVVIDKHSTGGVGDKVSLILMPILSSIGIKSAKISGRGLGHTGGTIDKLDSVHVKCDLSKSQYTKVFEKEGMFIISQTEDIVPADKKLYALRDTTETIDSLPLMAASIMSKKLAVDTSHIFLDIKVGEGAFCKDVQTAVKLAKLMVNLSKRHKRYTKCHITSMAEPLGRAVGNAIEIKETIECLKGQWSDENLKTLIYDFAIDVLITTKFCNDKTKAKALIDEAINSGKAIKKFYSWIKAQKGTVDLLQKDNFFEPKFKKTIKAEKTGYLEFLSTKEVGITSVLLGAGRIKKSDMIDYQAGIYLNKKTNETVNEGEIVATLYSSKPISNQIVKHFKNNITINCKPIQKEPIVIEVVE